MPILGVRIDDAELSDALLYHLNRKQMFDATMLPFGRHLGAVAVNVRELLSSERGTTDLASLRVPEVVAETAPRRPQIPNPQVSRKRPVCLLIIVDQSFSMNHRIAGRDVRKKDALADTVNRVLFNAVLSSTKDDGIRHYFDVGVLGYGAVGGVASALDSERDLVPIDWVADNVRRWATHGGRGGRRRRDRAPRGGRAGLARAVREGPHAHEGGVRARAGRGNGVDCRAPRNRSRRSSCTSPTAASSTTTLRPRFGSCKSLRTEVGNVLVFNCHVSETEGETVMFPGAEEVARLDSRSRRMHDMSSPLPEPMRQQAVAFGYTLEEGARGYVLNADFASLINFLNIGTRPVWNGVVER